MVAYMRGFIVLFVVLTILLHLPPQNGYQKYIRFFAELVMTMALLTPVLSLFCDSEEFLKLIEYEAFTEELSAVSKDMEHIEYLYGDYHREAYEDAIAEDVRRIAEDYHFYVREVSVKLSEEYVVEHIALWISEDEEEQIQIERVEVTGEEEKGEEDGGAIISRGLKAELMEYYQLEENEIEIRYVNG